MGIENDINIFCRAKYPVLWVQTSEETRLARMLKRVAQDISRDLLCWTFTEGLKNESGEPVGGQGTSDPTRLLDEIRKYPSPAVILLKDPHDFLKDPRVKRKFRDVYHVLKGMSKTIVISSPMLDIPPELMAEITIVDFALPDAEELGVILDEGVDGLRQQAEEGNEKARELLPKIEQAIGENRDAIIRAGLGLTSETFENIIAKCLAMHTMDVEIILGEKQQAIRKSGLLEFYPASTSMQEVGGLDNLKKWLDLRERAFSQEAQDFGLPAPKGVILVGIPGTGKSLVAKSLAARWHLPLLRLDVGSLFGSLVGQSEDRTRKALSMAESISPVILWVDEIEKAFSFGGGDNGTSQRVFATILTWMQDKKKPCFIIATANNISALPPELQRKGRFDEIFFLDLPTYAERVEILTVHLKKNRCDPKEFSLHRLAQVSENYVGAEIEQAIIDARYLAFAEGKRKLTTADVEGTLQKVVPLSKSQSETITGLKTWLKEGRAISASIPDTEKEKTVRKVEV